MKRATTGLAQSVQTRLVRHAKDLGLDPNLVLARYAAERFLYRLSRSRHADRFVLKGALLMLAWLGETIRPTRDVDLLGFGDLSGSALAASLHEILSVEVEADGVTFDLSSIQIEAIRAEDLYGGQRATFLAFLGTTRLKVQVDVGIGDAVEPEPELLEYPQPSRSATSATARISPRDGDRRKASCHGHARRHEQPHARLLRHSRTGDEAVVRRRRPGASPPRDVRGSRYADSGGYQPDP